MTHVAAPTFNSAAASEVSYREAVGGGRWPVAAGREASRHLGHIRIDDAFRF
jgi:hypothetical protein